MTDFARQERCIHPEVGIMSGLGRTPDRWFCGQCNFEFVPLPSLGKPLAYCGQDMCRYSIMQSVLIGRQQGSEQKPAEAHAATEIAAEPNEIRVCGKHIVSFAGNEPCGICGGAESADIGKLDTADEREQSFKEALTAALYRVYPKHTISVGHVAVEMRDWLAGSAETGGEKAAPEHMRFKFECGCSYTMWASGNQIKSGLSCCSMHECSGQSLGNILKKCPMLLVEAPRLI